MTENMIKISANELLRLLAGESEPDSFLEKCREAGKSSAKGEFSPFKAQLRRGMSIKSIAVEHTPDFDDDWLLLHFGPDPAISTLKVAEK